MRTTKRTVVAATMAATLFLGYSGLLETVHAAPRRPVEAGATTPGFFNQARCNAFANAINQLADRAGHYEGTSFGDQLKDQAKQKQDEATDNGCFIVNPL